MKFLTSNKKVYMISGVTIVGCMLIGRGLGSIAGYDEAGTFIGLGIGLIAMGILFNKLR